MRITEQTETTMFFLSLILRVLFKAELERKNALYFSILEKRHSNP